MRIRIREPILCWLLRLIKQFDNRNCAENAFDPDHVRSILLISSSALGDTVLSTAAMVAIRRRYPRTRITALIYRPYIELFRHLPELDEVVAYHGGYRHFLRTAWLLRKTSCDLALILHGNEPQATPLAYLSGARFIFKLPNNSRFNFLLSNQNPVLTSRELGHGLHQRLRVAALAGADAFDSRMTLPRSPGNLAAIKSWLERNGIEAGATLIGFQVGASSRGRMWPAEHFISLARQLLANNSQRRIVITGAPEETAYCRSIAEAIGPAALVSAGQIAIEQLPTVVESLSVLISGDTGTLHVAVAVGTPTVGLFAISHPEISGPAYDLDKHVMIYRPCPDAAIRSKSDDQSCIRRIEVAEVLAAVEDVLARSEVGHG